MKRLLLLFLFVFSCFCGYCKDPITVTLFHSPHCLACMEFKKEILPPLKERYGTEVEWVELNTKAEPENLEMLIAINSRFRKGRPLIPSVLVGDGLLVGSKEIRKNIVGAIERELKEKRETVIPRSIDLVKIFKNLSPLAVATSGLIDGVNPCAFAVIVFFISFLTVYGYGRRETICVGTFYCLAVFITYLLIGMGIFQFLYSLGTFYYAIKLFYYLVAFFCFALSAAAVRDYISYKKGADPRASILQLPRFLKKRINLVIGNRLRKRKRESLFRLCLTSLTVGFLVSLLEAVCTGQVYVPVIVFILKNTGLKIKAFLYLLLYNFMFIAPLIFIFCISLLGVSSAKLNDFFKRHLGTLKLLMALLFLVLGIFIVWIS